MAQRQKNINDEISKLISEIQKKQEIEENKRRLERLKEEEKRNLEQLDDLESQLAMGDMRDPQVRKALQQLQETRDQMNRSLENLKEDELQQARLSSSKAISALDQMQEQLKQYSREAAFQRMKKLQEKMREMNEDQQNIVEQMREITEEQEIPLLTSHQDDQDKKQQIKEKKEQLAEQFMDTIEMAGDLSERSDQSQKLMSQKLGDWLRQTSQKGILEDIEKEKQVPLIQYSIWDKAIEHEENIFEKLQESSNELDQVAQSMVSNDLEGMQLALNYLNDLLQQKDENNQSASLVSSSTQSSETQLSESQQSESQSESQPSEAQQLDNQTPNTQSPNTQSSNTQSSNTQTMERFIESDYRTWTQSLRNAEQLLPAESSHRERLTQIRERIEEMRSEYRRYSVPPKYDLFLEYISNPLVNTTRQLEEEIQKLLSEKEFVLTSEGDVPSNYQEQVADYFKALSEAEASR